MRYSIDPFEIYRVYETVLSRMLCIWMCVWREARVNSRTAGFTITKFECCRNRNQSTVRILCSQNCTSRRYTYIKIFSQMLNIYDMHPMQNPCLEIIRLIYFRHTCFYFYEASSMVVRGVWAMQIWKVQIIVT